MRSLPLLVRRVTSALAAVVGLGAISAVATPFLVVDADSGQVLIDNQGTAAWYPASLTTLMTVYVALDAVRNGRLTLDTPLIMSPRAARMAPSKMGFRPGTEVTLDNALKMLPRAERRTLPTRRWPDENGHRIEMGPFVGEQGMRRRQERRQGVVRRRAAAGGSRCLIRGGEACIFGGGERGRAAVQAHVRTGVD